MNYNPDLVERLMKDKVQTMQKEASARHLLKQAGLQRKGVFDTLRQVIRTIMGKRMSQMPFQKVKAPLPPHQFADGPDRQYPRIWIYWKRKTRY